MHWEGTQRAWESSKYFVDSKEVQSNIKYTTVVHVVLIDTLLNININKPLKQM